MSKILKIKKKAGIILLTAGIILVVLGILQGDYYNTMSKAVRICFECIGIG